MSKSKIFECPENVGTFKIYRMYHEELESIVKHFPTIKKAQFWMSFSDNYIKYIDILTKVGMTRIDPVLHNGKEIIPLQFLKTVLPDPSSLGPLTKGKTCIGCICKGIKNGTEKEHYIYNICDHEKAYEEVKSQAISYTTGVPAMIGAIMILKKIWQGKGVFNMEQFDPDPFMEMLNTYRLPWREIVL
jgi:saccharopine dehydrogenase (NAD+, L-lysine-forming)